MRLGMQGGRRLVIATIVCSALGAAACSGDDGGGVVPTNDAGGTSSSSSSGGGSSSSSSSGGSSSSSSSSGSTDDGGATGPKAQFATTVVDLGAGDCGGAAVTKTVSFENKGTKDLTVNLATSAPFTVTPPTLTVAPGAKGTVTVGVVVPSASTAGTAVTGSVTVTTNDPALKSATVPVSVTPQGATLAFDTGSPTSADFGTAKVNVAADPKTLKLKNKGNKPATFAFSKPADTQFDLSTSPASPASLDAAAVVTVTASFTPNKLSASTSVSNITVTGAVCGPSVTKIDFAGQGVVGNVSGFPSSALDFGLSPCGGAAAPTKSFTLTNSGPAPVKLASIAFAGSKGYSVDRSDGAVIPANGSLVVTVTPPAIPFPSAVPGDYGDTLTITTDIPDDGPHAIPVTVSAQGAILELDTSATANFGAFGPVPVGTTASHELAVKNTGNADAAVTASAGTGVFGVSAASFNVPPAGAQVFSATFAPTAAGPVTGSLGVNATGLCKALPPALQLSGNGQAGGISLSTNALSFETACNTTADPQTFTVTNSGNQPMTWSASLKNGATSEYTLSSTGSTLAAGDFITVTVTPKAIPQYPSTIDPSAYADTVAITTDIPGDVEHSLSLTEKPIGAVLTFEPSALQFGGVPINTTADPQSFSVKNSGNPGSNADITISSDKAEFAVQTTTGTVNVGESFASSLTFAPGSSATSQSANITVATTSPICAPLPSALTAEGTGTAGQVVFSPPSLGFGNVNCGGTAAPKTITFSNPGNQDYKITNLALQTGTYFTVSMSPASGIVPSNNGGTVVVTVTPNAIPQNVASLPSTSTFSDQLTVTTNAANDTPHNVGLTMGAKGVILKPIASKTWAFGTVAYGASGYYSVGIRNDGNVPVTMSMTGNALAVFGMNPTTVPANGAATLKGIFTPDAQNQSYADTATLTVPADTVFCQPEPNYDLVMTGTSSGLADVTISGNLSFPPVDCNGAANLPLSITIHNGTNTAQPYSATLDQGKWYTITSAASGTVPANGTATVTVTPKQITTSQGAYSGSSSYADQLFINVNGVGYTSPITETAKGSDIYGGWDTQVYWWYYYGWGGQICAYNSGNFNATMASSISDPSFTSTASLNLTAGSGWQCARHNWTYSSSTPYCYYNVANFTANVSTTGVVCHTDFPTQYTLGAYACD